LKYLGVVISFLVTVVCLVIACENKKDEKKAVIRHTDQEILKQDSIANDYEALYSLYEQRENKKLEKQLYQFEKKAGEKPENIALIHFYKAYLYGTNSVYDTAAMLFDKAIPGLQKYKHNKEQISAMMEYALTNTTLGANEKAIKIRYQVINLLDKSKDWQEKENTCHKIFGDLAIDFFLVQDYAKANEYMNKALLYFRKENDIKNIALYESAKSVMLFREKKFDSSLTFSRHSLELRTQLQDTLGQAESNNNIAIAYMGKGNWELGLKYLNKAKTLYERAGNNDRIPTILQNIGQCLQEKKDIKGAIEKFQLSYEVAQSTKLLNESKIALKKLAQLYRMQEDYKESLSYYVKYSKISDTMFTIQKQKTIQEIATKYETRKKEEQILLLQKDKQLAKQKIILFVSVLIFLVVIGLFVVIYVVFRNRKNKQILISDLKLQESQIELLKMEMEIKKKELDNFTDKLITKSNVIQELETKLKEYNAKNDNIIRLQDITELSKMKILTEEDWQLFKDFFEKVYSGFISGIRNRYNNLTQAELRMLLLIKLNLDALEIATILGISHESVKKGRYRLKKKLELKPEDDLNSYIQNITF